MGVEPRFFKVRAVLIFAPSIYVEAGVRSVHSGNEHLDKLAAFIALWAFSVRPRHDLAFFGEHPNF